jgi:hypothetical protein
MSDSDNSDPLYHSDKKNIVESGECKLYRRPSGAVDIFIKKDVGEKIDVPNQTRLDVILFRNGDILLRRKSHGASAGG